jgi:hypothetical protein
LDAQGHDGVRLGTEQRVCGPGDVVVIPGGTEHEAWFREDAEVLDFFAPPRDDFLLGLATRKSLPASSSRRSQRDLQLIV